MSILSDKRRLEEIAQGYRIGVDLRRVEAVLVRLEAIGEDLKGIELLGDPAIQARLDAADRFRLLAMQELGGIR